MKKTLFFLALLMAFPLVAQNLKGSIRVDSLYSKNLENPMGENPKRAISVYLPPNYDQSKQDYPVVYFLHGYFGTNDLMKEMVEVLDNAIELKKIRPFILVISDQRTTYFGSFYTNSSLYGKWEDFTTYDVVDYIDSHYRTLKNKESRGITGHSMGGYGALKIAMKHPDIFSSVYALSPGVLSIAAEYGPNSNTYKDLAKIKTTEELNKSYFSLVMVAFGKSFSPNPNNPPYYCDFPFEYKDGITHTNPEVLQKWQSNMPSHMIENYLDNLFKLKAIKLDWGRNAGIRFTQQCHMFSQRLENVGVLHEAEEYIGTHTSGIYTRNGRIENEMLPFFNTNLKFL